MPGNFHHRDQMRLSMTQGTGRMGVTDVAHALGVHRRRILDWIERDWLSARKRSIAGAPYYVISEEDVLRFLKERTALLPYLHPNKEWCSVVEATQKALLCIYIERHDLVRLLHLSLNTLPFLKRNKDFPRPSISISHVCSYYRKIDVAGWLRLHKDAYDSDGHIVRELLYKEK